MYPSEWYILGSPLTNNYAKSWSKLEVQRRVGDPCCVVRCLNDPAFVCDRHPSQAAWQGSDDWLRKSSRVRGGSRTLLLHAFRSLWPSVRVWLGLCSAPTESSLNFQVCDNKATKTKQKKTKEIVVVVAGLLRSSLKSIT